MSELSARPLLSSALDAELFVARERELEVLERSARERLNVLVLGPAGAGKTSLLHHFERRLDGDDELTPVFVDGARGVETAEELLALIAYRLGGTPDAFARRTGTEAALVALGDVRRALEGVRRRPVLILDELPNGELARTLFGRLRDELWSLPATWVVASESGEQAAYLRPPASAFFETVVTVEPLPEADSVELLRRRAELPDGTLREIAGAAEGNPRRLVALAREVLLDGRDVGSAAGERSERETRARAVGEAAARLVDYLEASGPASASDERLLADLGWSRSRATQVLRDLEQAGLVAPVRESSGNGRRKVYALS